MFNALLDVILWNLILVGRSVSCLFCFLHNSVESPMVVWSRTSEFFFTYYGQLFKKEMLLSLHMVLVPLSLIDSRVNGSHTGSSKQMLG